MAETYRVYYMPEGARGYRVWVRPHPIIEPNQAEYATRFPTFTEASQIATHLESTIVCHAYIEAVSDGPRPIVTCAACGADVPDGQPCLCDGAVRR